MNSEDKPVSLIYRLISKLFRSLFVFLILSVSILFVISPLFFIHKELTLTFPELMGYKVQPVVVSGVSTCNVTSSGERNKTYSETITVQIDQTYYPVYGLPCNLTQAGETVHAVTSQRNGRLFLNGLKEGAWTSNSIFLIVISIMGMPILGIVLAFRFIPGFAGWVGKLIKLRTNPPPL